MNNNLALTRGAFNSLNGQSRAELKNVSFRLGSQIHRSTKQADKTAPSTQAQACMETGCELSRGRQPAGPMRPLWPASRVLPPH